MRISDPIEQAEARVESWMETHASGDRFICACGSRFKLEDGVILTPDPNGIPVCPKCAMHDPAYAKWFTEQRSPESPK